MMRTCLLVSLAALAAVAACGDRPAPRVTLDASGSTFQKAAQELAIEAFTKAHPDVAINYGGGGSGKGRQDLADGVVDYACTDAPYPPEDAAKAKGGELISIPAVLGAITVSYHLPGVDRLQLSAATLAKIFQREITSWSDPAIAADNPGVTLPALDIVVARRADGSGTTESFTRYLAVAAPGVWKLQRGSTVEWPADTQAGNGNGGVAQLVKSTAGAIGYVDLSDARGARLRAAAIRNRAGHYVAPTAAAVAAAGAGLTVGDDLVFSALDAPGDAAYPITAQSWCVAYRQQRDPAEGAALVAYLTFLVTDAQALLPELDFAPIPERLQARALAQIERIQVP